MTAAGQRNEGEVNRRAKALDLRVNFHYGGWCAGNLPEIGWEAWACVWMTGEKALDSDGALALVLDRATSAGNRRSPLFAWMWARREALIPRLRGRNLNWDGMLSAVHELGLCDRSGNLPTKQTLQQTCRRLLRAADREAGRSGRTRAEPQERPKLDQGVTILPNEHTDGALQRSRPVIPMLTVARPKGLDSTDATRGADLDPGNRRRPPEPLR